MHSNIMKERVEVYTLKPVCSTGSAKYHLWTDEENVKSYFWI